MDKATSHHSFYKENPYIYVLFHIEAHDMTDL